MIMKYFFILDSEIYSSKLYQYIGVHFHSNNPFHGISWRYVLLLCSLYCNGI